MSLTQMCQEENEKWGLWRSTIQWGLSAAVWSIMPLSSPGSLPETDTSPLRQQFERTHPRSSPQTFPFPQPAAMHHLVNSFKSNYFLPLFHCSLGGCNGITMLQNLLSYIIFLWGHNITTAFLPSSSEHCLNFGFADGLLFNFFTFT